jgi:hypothetical protein
VVYSGYQRKACLQGDDAKLLSQTMDDKIRSFESFDEFTDKVP